MPRIHPWSGVGSAEFDWYGPFWIIPIIDNAPTWIDHRVMVSPFAAQKTLTKDIVPVDVDAVLLWVVWDAEKAALEVENYHAAVDFGRHRRHCAISLGE